MIEVRRSRPDEREQLYKLWALVFEEDLVWLDRFFATRYDASSIFLATVDGVIASALHALPATYIQDGKTLPASYIVGAATDPSYRRQGLMGKLLAATAAAYDHPITLFPAVRPYYEANVYMTTSQTLTFALSPTDTSPIVTSGYDWQALDAIYTRANEKKGYLIRDQVAWQFLGDGYQTIVTDNAYAFIKDGKAVEANSLDEQSANRLIERLRAAGVKSIQTLAESTLSTLLGEKEGVPTPMGMSTHASMAGVYIAEQY
ncbi:MAG: GNAT family N-acetyltransferase [Spirochaetales bacterium]|nr:GNAT family N-acetyltransferase [Spirochaetales bacterium]